MKTRILRLASLLLVVLAVAGCDLASIQLLIDLDVQGTYHSTDTNVASIAIDLTENSDFKDHQDQIKSVDQVGFVFRAQNNISTAATGQIYFSATPIANPTAANIKSHGTLILTGLTLPSNGSVDIDFAESVKLQVEANQPAFHEQVKTGQIYLYGIADTTDFDITVDQLTLVAVITAGT